MRKLFVAAATVANFALLVTPGVRRQVAEKGTARVAPDRRRPRTRASRSRTTVTSLAWNGRLGDHSRRNRRLGVTDEPRLVLPGRKTATASTSGRTTAETSCTPRCDCPTRSSPPGGGGSEWLWSRGDAECWAVLYAYGWKGGVESTPRARVGRLPQGRLRPIQAG